MITQGGSVSPFIRSMLKTKADGSVEAPKHIIQTVAAAYNQYVGLRDAHLERIAVYAALLGMAQGNPPYDQEELEANGLGHICNANNFKFRSAYERSAQSLWNLINSTEVFVRVELAGRYPNQRKWADSIARNFSDVVKEWPDFAPNFNLLGSQLTLYGLCPVIFPHEESPMWEVVDVSKFFIPSQALSFTSKLSNVCVDTVYTVQDLYQIYEDADENSAWNRQALGNFLLLRANIITQNTAAPGWSLMELQRFISNNDATVNTFFTDTVRLVNMYQKEYNGKISHYIFSADMFSSFNGYGGNGNVKIPEDGSVSDDFLYFVADQYDSLDEAIVIFTASPGEWNIHSNIGVGQKMFAMSEAVNMLDCNIVDMAKMAATPLLRTLATGGRDMSPIRIYPGVFTDIGAAEFQENNLGGNINQLVGASQYLTAGIETNAVNSGDNPSFPDRSQGSISASQARSMDYKEFGVLRNVVAHFYNTFDKVVKLVFIRFLTCPKNAPGYELSQEFKRRCFEDGVPEELLQYAKRGLNGLPRQFRSVKASRVAGDGSTLARLMGLQELAPIMGTFNQQELAEYKREYVAATLGVDYIGAFASSDEQGDELSGGASLARQEDINMRVAAKMGDYDPALAPLASADNDQAAHGDEHMGTATGIVQAVAQQQLSPVDADRIMQYLIPHLTQHIEFMSKARQFYRDTLNRLQKPYKELLKWAQLNRRNAKAMIEAAIRKQQEDQEATQQVMSDAQRKDFVAQADVARADKKVEAQNARAAEANETRADIMRTKAERDADNKRYQIELDAKAKQGGSVQQAAQQELAARTPEQLSRDLDNILGTTPSAVDFEGI
jgi:hypothetical protein